MIASNISDRVRVLLITEGTYPYHWGGVSTWCHLLLRELTEVDFTLMSIVTDPRKKPQFELPQSVSRFIPVPLWGMCNALEIRRELSLPDVVQRKRKINEALVTQDFIPLFRPFLQAIFGGSGDPAQLSQLIHQMYRFFLAYDFDATLRSRAVWDCFVQVAQDEFPRSAARHGYPDADYTLFDLTTALQWLYHWLFPIARPLPASDVVHAAMVGLSTLIAVTAKLEYGAAYFLTEHGIYLRESYLAEASASESLFLKVLKIHFARCMTALSYAMADQISPCCDYNKRWELKNGALPDRLKTIYYGVDSAEFMPADKPIDEPPVVVWVGRINPLKDLETLLQAAALVHQSRPDIQFRLFGSAAAEDESYFAAMKALHAELDLGEAAIFCGYAAKPVFAFNQGDIVVLSSISEAFPFSILEAMLCGKPIVATAVGGIPEQIEGCGIAVEPRNPATMAEAILTLMNDEEKRANFGRAAREKAAQEFSVQQSSDAHYETYLSLSSRHRVARLSHAPAETVLSPEAEANETVSVADPIPLTSDPRVLELGDHRLDLERQLLVTVNKAPIVTNSQQPEFTAPDTEAIAALAVKVDHRVPLPVDSFEITAVLESLGITDEVAARRYGVPDVFALAESILTQVRNSRWQSNTERAA
jgi:polysaccharide biosynthesis protein PelF